MIVAVPVYLVYSLFTSRLWKQPAFFSLLYLCIGLIVMNSNNYFHPCNKSPSAIAVTIVAATAVPRAAAIAGVRAYESVPLYAVPL